MQSKTSCGDFVMAYITTFLSIYFLWFASLAVLDQEFSMLPNASIFVLFGPGIHQFVSHKLVYNGGFQTLNCRYLFGIRPMWPKFCVALVTRYDLQS